MPDYTAQITMRSRDQLPTLGFAIETDDGHPVDLTGATHVDIMITHEDGSDPRVETIGNPRLGYLLLPGNVINPTIGLVGYDWQPVDALRPGVLHVAVIAYLPTGIISAPTDRSAILTMRPDPVSIFGGNVPGRFDLNLYRGDTYIWQFRLWADDARTQPVFVNGFSTPVAEIRNKPGGAIIVPLTAFNPDGAGGNVIQVSIDAESSKLVPTRGVWDLEVHWNSGPIQTVVAGNVHATPDVTGSLFSSLAEVEHV